ITMLSLGVPMIVMGDEVRRTQYGNNNAYSQDNETGWFDWTLLEKHADLHRFVKLLIARRLLRDTDAERDDTTLNELLRTSIQAWHGMKLHQPDWNPWSHSLAFGAQLRNEPRTFHLILNVYGDPLAFKLPPVDAANPWRRWIDTSRESPEDIVAWRSALPVAGGSYRAGPRSVVVLYTALAEAESAR